MDLNAKVQRQIRYVVRMEPGVQTPDETLTLGSGSCRDSAWLLVQMMRKLGFAARFVSGYLIQLKADIDPVAGAQGTRTDFTDLHAWAEVYLPGAGWIGLDVTSGLLTGEGHLPLAAAPHYRSCAPITGVAGVAKTTFEFEMSVQRLVDPVRITRPFEDASWDAMVRAGRHGWRPTWRTQDVRLTMGGEPTFVSIDDFEAAEWNTAALGAEKLALSAQLIDRLRDRFGPGGVLHYGQGKWYPGEPLPRWALGLYWRRDGVPVWRGGEPAGRWRGEATADAAPDPHHPAGRAAGRRSRPRPAGPRRPAGGASRPRAICPMAWRWRMRRHRQRRRPRRPAPRHAAAAFRRSSAMCCLCAGPSPRPRARAG